MKKCNQCGKCCTKFGGGNLAVTPEEIALWEIFRPDIFNYVDDGKIWVDPESKKTLERCPWMRRAPDQEKYFCDIYLDRPDDCKFYPVTIKQMIDDECEMLEVKDLSNPKRAQDILNQIMSDSRPPYELE